MFLNNRQPLFQIKEYFVYNLGHIWDDEMSMPTV